MADFGVTEDGHPDEVVLPGSRDYAARSSERSQSSVAGSVNDRNRQPVNGPPSRPMQPPSKPTVQPPRAPQTPNQHAQRPTGQFQGRPAPQQPLPRSHGQTNTAAQQGVPNNRMMTPPPNPMSRPPSGMNPPNGAPNESATFFSARSLKDLPETADPGTAVSIDRAAKVFDPHADSPSIRKTPGIDHRSTKPVSRSGVHVPPKKPELDNLTSAPIAPPNVVNPSLSQLRQIGTPRAMGSPLGNRGQYRPLTMKRPAPGGPDGGGGGGGNRAPLTDVSTNGAPGGAAGAAGIDAKRQKMT